MKSVSICMLLAVLCLASPQSFAAPSIQGVASAPLDAGGVFDVGNPGIQYSLGPGTVLNTPVGGSYDVRDIFGGTFGTFLPEKGNVVFADNQSQGTVETINVTLPQPVTLGSFELFLEEDGPGNGFSPAGRSTSDFQLFAGSTLLDDVATPTSGFTIFEVQDTLVNAPATASYSLKFTQGDGDGLRVDEFGASAISVPEPSTITLLGIASVVALKRSRRV